MAPDELNRTIVAPLENACAGAADKTVTASILLALGIVSKLAVNSPDCDVND